MSLDVWPRRCARFVLTVSVAYAYGKPRELGEHSGQSGGPIPVDMSTLTTAELAARAEALAHRLKG